MKKLIQLKKANFYPKDINDVEDRVAVLKENGSYKLD